MMLAAVWMSVSFAISEALLVYYSKIGTPLLAVVVILLGLSTAMPGFCFVSEIKRKARIQVERVEQYIEEKAFSEKEAKDLSERDTLTGLINRRNLIEKIEAVRNSSKGLFAIMMVDLDRFKPINDIHGHHVGDIVLVEIAKRLVFKAGDKGLVARLGGDEFIVAYPARSQIEIIRKAAQIVESMSSPVIHEKTAHSVGASIGVAISRDGQNIKSLMTEADIAMYEAKSTGRGKYNLYNEELSLKSKRKADIQRKLVTAIETSQINYVYQPVYNMLTGKLCAFETYSRWDDSEIGEISPLEFISAGEESGLIEDLAISSFEGAMDLARNLPADIKVGVNLSIKALKRRITAETMLGISAKNNISPRQIILEIKESSDLKEIDRIKNEIFYLKSKGFCLALDDFGTGDSTLSSLVNYSFDIIKLDRYYSNNIQNPEIQKVAKAVMALSRALDIETLAEGVETHEQANFFKRMGFEYGQGYHYNRPLSLEDAIAIATNKKIQHVVA